jgi:hypothetical protein
MEKIEMITIEKTNTALINMSGDQVIETERSLIILMGI